MHEFNTERPHEALAMKCPAELYAVSPRRYNGLPARSGPSRSAVPIDREQSFRLIPIIRSGITISLWTGANGTVG